MSDPESTLLDSWQHNAQAWIDAVRSGAIESRRQVTDQAILLAILGRQPERVLDLGCGEGWLLRALDDRGIEAVGVDGDRALVDAARAVGAAEVHLASYAQLAEGEVYVGKGYDLVCANFALLHQDIIPLLAAMNDLLVPGGALVIQTLHPWSVAGGDYQDGWREESFATDAVVLPYPGQLAECAGHGRVEASQPAGATAPAECGSAVVVAGG